MTRHRPVEAGDVAALESQYGGPELSGSKVFNGSPLRDGTWRDLVVFGRLHGGNT
jgi:hypothetical protein